jgi:hypothetical protein
MADQGCIPWACPQSVTSRGGRCVHAIAPAGRRSTRRPLLPLSVERLLAKDVAALTNHTALNLESDTDRFTVPIEVLCQGGDSFARRSGSQFGRLLAAMRVGCAVGSDRLDTSR